MLIVSNFFMVNRSRFQEDHEIKKDTGKRDKASFNRRKEKDATASREISEDHDSKYMHRASSPRNASSGGNIPETIRNFISRKDDLIGSQVRVESRDALSCFCSVSFTTNASTGIRYNW